MVQVGGKVAMDLTMPATLAWVLGGNVSNLRFQDRTPHCRLPDKPKAFNESVSGCSAVAVEAPAVQEYCQQGRVTGNSAVQACRRRAYAFNEAATCQGRRAAHFQHCVL